MVTVLSGGINHYDRTQIQGWVNDGDAIIQVWYGEQIIDEFSSSTFTIGDTSHSKVNFIYKISPRYLDGSAYQLDFRFKSSGASFDHSPVQIQFLYEALYIPFHTTDLTGNRVLVLAPHADDETFACGGAIALHRQRNDDVKIVILTDGSKGNISEQGVQDYIAIRQEEARQACAILNVTDIEFWDSPDRALVQDKYIQDRLRNVINTYRPSLIYAPSPLEYHPDHQATAYHLWEALRNVELDVRVAFWGTNRPLKNNTLVDISSVVEKKREASHIYQSQLKNHPYTDCCLGLNRYTSLTVSQQCDYVEGYYILDAEAINDYSLQYFGELQINTNVQFNQEEAFDSVYSLKAENKQLTALLLESQERIGELENANIKLIKHSHHLEKEANSPRLVAGLYRTLVPIQARLWLRDRLGQ